VEEFQWISGDWVWNSTFTVALAQYSQGQLKLIHNVNLSSLLAIVSQNPQKCRVPLLCRIESAPEGIIIRICKSDDSKTLKRGVDLFWCAVYSLSSKIRLLSQKPSKKEVSPHSGSPSSAVQPQCLCTRSFRSFLLSPIESNYSDLCLRRLHSSLLQRNRGRVPLHV
jgi:hypothetical protein